MYIDGHELGEYYFSEAGHAIIHEMDGQGPLGYRVIPARPALVLRGLRFELALQGESPSFDFGEYDHLGNISFFASDDTDTDEIVEVDLDEFFPGPNFEDDPDHTRLVKYGEVAAEESFACEADDFVDQTTQLAIDGFFFECPAVATAADCAAFPLEKLRVWVEAAASDWDGVTRVADLLQSGTLKPEVWARCRPRLKLQLQMHAAEHIIKNVRTYVEQKLLELRGVAAETDAEAQSTIEMMTALLAGNTSLADGG